MDVLVDIPDGTALDGAVVELGTVDGHLVADVRIPARQD
jgi:hypothetical protein